jgi:hypothetical protein
MKRAQCNRIFMRHERPTAPIRVCRRARFSGDDAAVVRDALVVVVT